MRNNSLLFFSFRKQMAQNYLNGFTQYTSIILPTWVNLKFMSGLLCVKIKQGHRREGVKGM